MIELVLLESELDQSGLALITNFYLRTKHTTIQIFPYTRQFTTSSFWVTIPSMDCNWHDRYKRTGLSYVIIIAKRLFLPTVTTTFIFVSDIKWSWLASSIWRKYSDCSMNEIIDICSKILWKNHPLIIVKIYIFIKNYKYKYILCKR